MRPLVIALCLLAAVLSLPGCAPRTGDVEIKRISLDYRQVILSEKFEKIRGNAETLSASTEDITNWLFKREKTKAHLAVVPEANYHPDNSPDNIQVYFYMETSRSDRFFKSEHYRAENSKLAVHLAESICIFLKRFNADKDFKKKYASISFKGIADSRQKTRKVAIYMGEYGTLEVPSPDGKATVKVKRGHGVDNPTLAYIRAHSFKLLLNKRFKAHGIKKSCLIDTSTIGLVAAVAGSPSRRVDVRLTFPAEALMPEEKPVES